MIDRTGFLRLACVFVWVLFACHAGTGSGLAQAVPPGMVLVEGGTFLMGDATGNEAGQFGDGDYDEKPEHKVTVGSFYIGKNEVSFDEYDAFCEESGRVKPDDQNWGRANRPVINVSWIDAVAYCNWRSQQEGLTPAYRQNGDDVFCDFSATGYRLPTEAEWEYAARGGSKGGGYKYSGGNTVNNVARDGDNSSGQTQPVGQKQANELGIYDMSGNVREWCWDRYGRYSNVALDNPVGPSSGIDRVIRGGGWDDAAGNVRVAVRRDHTPGYRLYNLGFRLARTGLARSEGP